VIAIPTGDDVDGIADQQSAELYGIRVRRAGWLQQACMAQWPVVQRTRI